MPLFRFHRGGLHDSLQTTRIVKDMKDLRDKVKNYLGDVFCIDVTEDFILEISPYPSDNDNFDSRIGWFTHFVSITLIGNPDNRVVKMMDRTPIGFLSEPLED